MMAKKYRDTIAKAMDEEWNGASIENANLNDHKCEDKESSRMRLIQYLYGYRVLQDMVCRLGLYWERNEMGRHYVGNE